jgi:hypothetical protein
MMGSEPRRRGFPRYAVLPGLQAGGQRSEPGGGCCGGRELRVLLVLGL